MSRPPFPAFDGFIETAFERRFQSVLRSAWQRRSWHVIVTEPGSGKTMGITDLVRATGLPSGTLAGRSYPVLAITAPKNDPKEGALGSHIRGCWSERKYRLMEPLVRFGVECLIIDDAHDLSMPHLTFLKELTDLGSLPPYEHPLGLCLVTAGRGSAMPLKEVFDQPETMWLQFRRRLDRLYPFCRIAGHTQEEVREILAALETVYRETFPQLNLRQWSGAIHTWLTNPVLDPTSSGRVVMDYVMKLVTTALEWSYAAGGTEVRAETLQAAAELLTLRRDAIRLIDGTGPTIEVREPGPEPESATQAEPAVEPAPNPPRRERRKKHSEEPAQGGEMHVPVPSPDESGARSVPSDGRSPTKPKRKRRAQNSKLKQDAVEESDPPLAT
jgi:hypothetical protein